MRREFDHIVCRAQANGNEAFLESFIDDRWTLDERRACRHEPEFAARLASYIANQTGWTTYARRKVK